jgi:hypothetical protein
VSSVLFPHGRAQQSFAIKSRKFVLVKSEHVKVIRPLVRTNTESHAANLGRRCWWRFRSDYWRGPRRCNPSRWFLLHRGSGQGTWDLSLAALQPSTKSSFLSLAVQAFQSHHDCTSIPFAKRIKADNQSSAIPDSELFRYQSW